MILIIQNNLKAIFKKLILTMIYILIIIFLLKINNLKIKLNLILHQD